MVVQAAGSKQACAELQLQLQQQTDRDREVSDLTRMATKVQDLEFDLGNIQQSLQVFYSQSQYDHYHIISVKSGLAIRNTE